MNGDIIRTILVYVYDDGDCFSLLKCSNALYGVSREFRDSIITVKALIAKFCMLDEDIILTVRYDISIETFLSVIIGKLDKNIVHEYMNNRINSMRLLRQSHTRSMRLSQQSHTRDPKSLSIVIELLLDRKRISNKKALRYAISVEDEASVTILLRRIPNHASREVCRLGSVALMKGMALHFTFFTFDIIGVIMESRENIEKIDYLTSSQIIHIIDILNYELVDDWLPLLVKYKDSIDDSMRIKVYRLFRNSCQFETICQEFDSSSLDQSLLVEIVTDDFVNLDLLLRYNKDTEFSRLACSNVRDNIQDFIKCVQTYVKLEGSPDDIFHDVLSGVIEIGGINDEIITYVCELPVCKQSPKIDDEIVEAVRHGRTLLIDELLRNGFRFIDGYSLERLYEQEMTISIKRRLVNRGSLCFVPPEESCITSRYHQILSQFL